MKNFEAKNEKDENSQRIILDNKVVRRALEARADGDRKAEVDAWRKITEYILYKVFGVENLTTIEGVGLRKILEDVIEKDIGMKAKLDLAFKEDRKDDAIAIKNNIPEIDTEAVHRWLLELYSIDLNQIQVDDIDGINKGFKEYLRRLREKAHSP